MQPPDSAATHLQEVEAELERHRAMLAKLQGEFAASRQEVQNLRVAEKNLSIWLDTAKFDAAWAQRQVAELTAEASQLRAQLASSEVPQAPPERPASRLFGRR